MRSRIYETTSNLADILSNIRTQSTAGRLRWRQRAIPRDIRPSNTGDTFADDRLASRDYLAWFAIGLHSTPATMGIHASKVELVVIARC